MFRSLCKLFFVTILMAFVVGGCSSPDETTGNRPLIAVLCDSSRSIETIDAQALKVVDSIKLRSLSLDFTLNKKNNLIYTAQCGLAGKDADNVVGVVDPRNGRVKRYIKLKYPNPSQIVSLDDIIYVIHGFMLKNGEFVGSAISVANNYSIRECNLPGIPNGININRGNVYTLIVTRNVSDEYLISFNPETNTTTKLNLGEKFRLPYITFDDNGNAYGLLYLRQGRLINSYRVVIFNPEQNKIIREIDLSSLKTLEGKLL